MPLNTLKDLLIRQISELHNAEQQDLQIFPKMAKAASSPKLAELFKSHTQETKTHLSRLEGIFDSLDAKPQRVECKAIKGLIDDCLKLATMPNAEPHVRDAAMIALAQRVKHDQIAGYGCARTWVQLMDIPDVSSILQKSLDDEHRIDENLTKLAQTLNKEALRPVVV